MFEEGGSVYEGVMTSIFSKVQARKGTTIGFVQNMLSAFERTLIVLLNRLILLLGSAKFLIGRECLVSTSAVYVYREGQLFLRKFPLL